MGRPWWLQQQTGEKYIVRPHGGASPYQTRWGARGGHYQGPQVRPGSQRVAVENPKNPRDCRDKSKIWACPLIECRGHVNYNWQKQCFGCKTYFYQALRSVWGTPWLLSSWN